jgi:hypothetical protein
LLLGRKQYYVRFHQNGSVFSAVQREYCLEYFDPGVKESFCFVKGQKFDLLDVELYADSREAAIKIAAEKRAKYLAEKEGIA